MSRSHLGVFSRAWRCPYWVTPVLGHGASGVPFRPTVSAVSAVSALSSSRRRGAPTAAKASDWDAPSGSGHLHEPQKAPRSTPVHGHHPWPIPDAAAGRAGAAAPRGRRQRVGRLGASPRPRPSISAGMSVFYWSWRCPNRPSLSRSVSVATYSVRQRDQCVDTCPKSPLLESLSRFLTVSRATVSL